MKKAILSFIRRGLGTNNINDKLFKIESQIQENLKLTNKIANPSLDSPQINTGKYISDGIRLAIMAADDQSFFKCNLNGQIAWLPGATLRTMVHCVHNGNDQIDVFVETAHINWMMQHLGSQNGKSLFVDVGSSTGAASIPIALKFTKDVSIIAFEPATNAYRLFSETIKRNNIGSVTLTKSAVSDFVGKVDFVEFGEDPTGNTPYLPEASTISFSGVSEENINRTNVDCVTLDEFLISGKNIVKNSFSVVVVKIDVEGFEEHVLKGSVNFIDQIRPYFSIDIHKRIGADGTTEGECRNFLSNFGYSFEKIGHVLLATPPKSMS
ncbi:MAG: FkbM family methyltransferase [Gemmataceae bacterium]|nr:FkbM family methyltransferase [Gemmataceae bacterium]